ncbi:2'-5' RNA ligase family protein, partial [Bacillus thuringiensis]|nr:2'-5' RNA ligase family protein [Bacillus thuringiensis]
VTESRIFHGELHCVIERLRVERSGESGEAIIEFEVPFLKS